MYQMLYKRNKETHNYSEALSDYKEKLLVLKGVLDKKGLESLGITVITSTVIHHDKKGLTSTTIEAEIVDIHRG